MCPKDKQVGSVTTAEEQEGSGLERRSERRGGAGMCRAFCRDCRVTKDFYAEHLGRPRNFGSSREIT